jgi:hypothetical protein
MVRGFSLFDCFGDGVDDGLVACHGSEGEEVFFYSDDVQFYFGGVVLVFGKKRAFKSVVDFEETDAGDGLFDKRIVPLAVGIELTNVSESCAELTHGDVHFGEVDVTFVELFGLGRRSFGLGWGGGSNGASEKGEEGNGRKDNTGHELILKGLRDLYRD